MNDTDTTTNSTISTTFVSPTNNLRIVFENARRKLVGENGDFVNLPGVYCQFVEGELVVSDPVELDKLRESDSYGKLFFELGQEPGRPGASTAELHKEILDLVFAGRYDTIADILVKERTTLSRPDVISSCEAAIANAGLQSPSKPGTPEHEIERLRLGAAVGPQPGADDLVPTETVTGAPAAAPPA
jgi:hypothetical protein